MSDQMFLAAIIGPTYLTLGLSAFFYKDIWKKIGSHWEKDHLTMLVLMFFSLIFGLVIINMHDIWEWSPYVIITVTGWLSFISGVVYFLLPGEKLKDIIRYLNCECYYQTIGAVLAVLGAWLSYLVYLA